MSDSPQAPSPALTSPQEARTPVLEIWKQLPTPIFVRNAQGVVLEANPAFAELLGKELGELVGHPVNFLRETAEEFTQIVEDRAVHHTEELWRDSQGRPRWFSITRIPLVRPTGQVDLLASATEITSRKQQEASLQQGRQELLEQKQRQEMSQRQLVQSVKLSTMSDLLAMIAHQWRQPLSRISTVAANESLRLKLKGVDPERTLTQLERIILQVQELSDMINDFRGHFDRGSHQTSPTMTEVIRGALQLCKDPLQEAKITVELDLEETATPLPTNDLTQVVLHLLKNAQEAILSTNPSQRTIWIQSRESAAGWCLRLEDNGRGFAPEVAEKLFEPYYSTKARLNGAGLGLYLSKLIVEEQYHGRIRATNGEAGACFEILLPRSVAEIPVPRNE